jgi:hypothetical protein
MIVLKVGWVGGREAIKKICSDPGRQDEGRNQSQDKGNLDANPGERYSGSVI